VLEEDKKFLDILPSLGIYRSLLCLNGNLPEYDFFSHFDLPIIAADGASILLLRKNIAADVVIGDWDSAKEPFAEKTKKVVIRDQSSSDFQKALKFIQENDLSPSIVLGINGGYLDHVFNNVGILSQTNSVGYFPPNIGFAVRCFLVLNLPIGTKLSLFGMPSGKINTQGLRWELKNQKLHFPEYNSCFNRTIVEQIGIDVYEGTIFLVIYLNDVIDGGIVGIEK
jgi:thiamine pyrophosphokinase